MIAHKYKFRTGFSKGDLPRDLLSKDYQKYIIQTGKEINPSTCWSPQTCPIYIPNNLQMHLTTFYYDINMALMKLATLGIPIPRNEQVDPSKFGLPAKDQVLVPLIDIVQYFNFCIRYHPY